MFGEIGFCLCTFRDAAFSDLLAVLFFLKSATMAEHFDSMVGAFGVVLVSLVLSALAVVADSRKATKPQDRRLLLAERRATDALVATLGKAKTNTFVQAYSFAEHPDVTYALAVYAGSRGDGSKRRTGWNGHSMWAGQNSSCGRWMILSG
jgi:hypothetical protein